MIEAGRAMRACATQPHPLAKSLVRQSSQIGRFQASVSEKSDKK
jgi:hypothetical protein